MAPLATFADVSIGYRSHVLTAGISWTIEPGSFWGIVGPNGSGKSTLVRTLLGIQPPIQGRVDSRGTRMAYVPQQGRFNTLVPLSVLDVVTMGLYGQLRVGQRPDASGRDLALAALNQLNMAEFASARFTELSGGQQQRAMIARALVAKPALLVLDEPTTGLDLVVTEALHRLVSDLCRLQGLAVIMVSHSLETVAQFADQLVLLARGRSEIGSIAELLTDEALSRLYGQPVRAPRLEAHHD